MAYTDYSFYKDGYLGNRIKDAAAFERLAERASAKVDELTRWRASGFMEANPKDTRIQKAVCAIAELILQSELGNPLVTAGIIKSEAVGKHQITYATGADMSSAAGQDAVNAAIRDEAARYLAPTGLLYRGVGLC